MVDKLSKLGDYVMDTVSGFKGVATSLHSYIDGCDRMTVQPLVDKEGKLPGNECFDLPRLKTIEKELHAIGDTTVGGPDKYEDKER